MTTTVNGIGLAVLFAATWLAYTLGMDGLPAHVPRLASVRYYETAVFVTYSFVTGGIAIAGFRAFVDGRRSGIPLEFFTRRIFANTVNLLAVFAVYALLAAVLVAIVTLPWIAFEELSHRAAETYSFLMIFGGFLIVFPLLSLILGPYVVMGFLLWTLPITVDDENVRTAYTQYGRMTSGNRWKLFALSLLFVLLIAPITFARHEMLQSTWSFFPLLTAVLWLATIPLRSLAVVFVLATLSSAYRQMRTETRG